MTHATPRRLAALAFTLVTASSLVACSSSAATQAPTASAAAAATAAPTAAATADPMQGHEAVAITVGALRPGATQEAVDALNLQIKEFETKYPWISVKPQEYNWTAPTFTAALAGGTLPTVFTIPFTDGKGLIAQHQIVNIDSRVRSYGYADKFNPNVLVNGQDADGKIWAVPTQAYGMSLTYNRTLFTQAGLDPNNPPKTWDDIRAAAKTIAAKVPGVAGYAEMATENTGGWQLTTSTYALGGRMETIGSDGKVTATLNNDQTKAALQRLHSMRWDDNSMGSTFDYAWGTINQAFASGQIGMFTGGSDLYTAMVQNNNLKADDYGVTIIPLEGSNAGVLGGGTLAAVNVVTTDAERDAAVAWIDFYYMQKLLTQEGAVADAQALKANNQPVGVPALPIFDKATYDQQQAWIKDYINVPTAQMTPFTSQIFSQPIVTEPTVHTQDLYAALDPVVQAVLTDKNADVNKLLDAANAAFQKILDQPAS
jgi:ABC-type glycerol-3-phosphate transport system substrate-binding protein